jgi:hypothetical protein
MTDAPVSGIPGPWTPSCAPTTRITPVESSAVSYGDDCVHGSWMLQSKNGTTVPATPVSEADVAVPPSAIARGFNPLDPASAFAIHVTGQGQVNHGNDTSYADIVATLNTNSDDETGTVDASQYTGIQFYGVIDVDAEAGAWLRVADLYTDPAGGMCDPDGGPTDCYDHPGAQLTLTSTWTLYQIPFASLTQFGGPGETNQSPVGAAFPRTAITYLQWLIGVPTTQANPAWELWIDDVAFY